MKYFMVFITLGLVVVEARGLVLEQRVDGLWYQSEVKVPYTGKAVSKHFDGTPISEINYFMGKQHGLSRFWYPSGKIRSTFNYSEGLLDGNSTYYYNNGNIQNLTTYRKGVKHGWVIDWWPKGKKSFAESYTNGYPEGVWSSWWPNGNLASENIYRNRRLIAHRQWTQNGMPRTVRGWNLDGSFKSAKSPQNRKRIIGRSIRWDRNSGNRRIAIIYRDKPLKTIRTVFGDPDQADDTHWTYKGLHIQDPENGGRFDTAIFRFKKGIVSEIWIE